MLKFRQGEFRTHRFLNGYNVNSLGSHVLNELAAATILAETADVPEEGSHHASIGGLLDPKTREALWAWRAAVWERLRPRISAGAADARGGPLGVVPSGAPAARGGHARASASRPSRISRARMASIWTSEGATSPRKTMAESAATLARWPSGADSKAEKEQVGEVAGMVMVPGSRFRAAARRAAYSGIGRTGLPTGMAASIRALRREEDTEDEVERPLLE